VSSATRLQGFFLTGLVEFGARELGEAAVERALREASPALRLPLDPTRACDPEIFHELARRLAGAAGVPIDAWLRRFGAALFAQLAVLHAVFFIGVGTAFDFLASFERNVHDEVRALDAGLAPPRMRAERLGPERLRVTYESDRDLAALAHGMLEGCLAHFGEPAVVRAEAARDGAVCFLIERVAAAPAAGGVQSGRAA
jgi:hypothetical protein